MTDDELMARGAAGHEEAFRTLVERWEAPVFRFLARTLGSDAEAEDVAQETFVRMCRSAKRYRADGRFASWLLRIAGNLARSRLRRRRVVTFLAFDPTVHDPGEPARAEADVRRRELRDAVTRAVERLPDRLREAFVLRYDAELSHA